MREIKFRGLNHETGEFVYGYYVKLLEGARWVKYIVQHEDCEDIKYYIHEEKSITQYTGLKDKNGVEIYEGDIVKVLHDDWPSRGSEDERTIEEYMSYLAELYVIEYDNAEFVMSFAKKGGYPHYMKGYERHGFIEVIGNIHQNKELLEVN